MPQGRPVARIDRTPVGTGDAVGRCSAWAVCRVAVLGGTRIVSGSHFVGTPNQPMRQYAMKRFPCPYERRRGNRNHSHPPADAAPLGIAPQTRGRPATTTAVEGHSLPFLHPSISSGAPSWKELANLLWVTWGFTLHNLRVHCASPDCTTQAVRRSTDTVGAMCVVGMHLDRHGRVSATKPGMRKADEIASKVKSNRVQRRFTALVEQPWPRSGCADQMPAMKGRMPFPSWRAYNMHNCQSADERHPPKPTSFFIPGRRRPLKSTLPAGRGYRLRMEAGGWIACHTAACSTTITTVADTPLCTPRGYLSR